jgi:putative RecB family exonuclease
VVLAMTEEGVHRMPMYSYSRIETYKNCPQQFKLHYIDKIEVEEEGIEAFMGSRVHEALEKLYTDIRMTKFPSLEELLAYYEDQWEKNWHDSIKIVRQEYRPEHYREVGRKAIAEYYEQHRPFDESRTIALEYKVNFPIDEAGEYTILGYIDRIAVARDGTYEIHDYKTSGRLPTQDEIDKDRQLALYQMAVAGMWPDVKKVDLVWHYMVFGKELRSRRTPRQLAGLKKEIMASIRTIEEDSDFRPKESALCDWCAYFSYCPAKKHEMAMAGLSPEEYAKESGVTLVNKYAELETRKDEVERELERVKAALIAYAKENEVENIKGSGHRVMVRFYKGLSLPRKDEPGRRELEELVKASGLWEQVSMMSPVSLSKLVERGALDEELAAKIIAMGRQEERPWVKLKKIARGRE